MLSPHHWGHIALFLVLLPTFLAFYALISFDSDTSPSDFLGSTYFLSILSFSLKQALLSAVLSVLLAIPVARALYYVPSLWGRQLFLSLCLLCFVMPTLVLITGLVALLGRSGWLTPLLGEDWNLYGLQGILIAHVFMNMPFAVRAIYLQLQNIPDTSWRLAAQLKLNHWQRWRLVEWPALRGRLLVLCGFVFVLCFNSFAVVLALGGGPQATTLEVAIYQALKYDFNMGEALILAWVQLLIAGGLFLVMTRFSSIAWLSQETVSGHYRPRAAGWSRYSYYILYGAAWLLLLLPLLALVPSTLRITPEKLWAMKLMQPLLTTIILGLICAVGALLLTYGLLLSQRYWRQNGQSFWLLEWLGNHTLVTPAMVLSAGLYIYCLQRFDVDEWGMLLVAVVNIVILIPFAHQQIKPRLLQFDDQYQRLVIGLKLGFWQRLLVEWPWLRQHLLATFALVLVLAMGDVAIFSIFGSNDWMTLPWLIYSYASTYRMGEASVAALVLLLLSGLVVWGFERTIMSTANRSGMNKPDSLSERGPSHANN